MSNTGQAQHQAKHQGRVAVVTDRDSIVAAADRVRDELGGADVLVNNAGVMLLGPFDTEQREDYRQMVEVNLLGVVATELPTHITHGETREGVQAMYDQAEVTADDLPAGGWHLGN